MSNQCRAYLRRGDGTRRRRWCLVSPAHDYTVECEQDHLTRRAWCISDYIGRGRSAAYLATLMEQLQRVAALERQLQAAIGTRDFAAAQRLQADLHAAREAHVIADAAARALRDGAVAAEQARAAAERQIQQATQRAQAEQMLAGARQAEQEHLAEGTGRA